MRILVTVALLLATATASAAEKPPIYYWFEPEWFEGVHGSFNYWTGTFKPTGSWGIAGPGISPEWTQGGESEWNSMGAAAEETKGECHRDFTVARPGKYRVWVRYFDHRNATEPFRVTIKQGEKAAVSSEFGIKPVVSPGDEFALYWGFAFGWDSIDVSLASGTARLSLAIERPGEAWRQVDAVVITNDLSYVPTAREKPHFRYLDAPRPAAGQAEAWRPSPADFPVGASWQRKKLAGLDFSMWTGIEAADLQWWRNQPLDQLSLYDIFFRWSPPADIRETFHKQYAGRRDLPLIGWPNLRPGMYLGTTPDLSPDSPLRKWFERTKTPFYIMTNYASPTYTEKTGPATYEALTGPLADQLLGYIHGEAIGTPGVYPELKARGSTRREHVDLLAKDILALQARSWSEIFKTPVPESYWAKGISCLSTLGDAYAHLFHEMGSQVVGYEEDSTMSHVPMRIAFERGAARQYGGAWISYTSGNFGDSCNYFTQQPVVARGAPSWYHSKYAVTDGVSIAWYRKLYYMNYLGGASAIYWEQSLGNQWILPGPGTHPIQLSPFGRATEDFQAFVSRLPDRGEPYTPIALLLSYGHGYDRVNNECKMLGVFQENAYDLELRELLNVFWQPAGQLEGLPAAPDVQSMPGGIYGNIFDVLVDRPTRAKAIFDYPIVWAAGDVELSGAWLPVLEDYVRRGGTLVINVEAARKLPASLLGVRLTRKKTVADHWQPAGESLQQATEFEVEGVENAGAQTLITAGESLPLATRYAPGKGAVILTLVPHLIGLDERAHPATAYLMHALTNGLLPIELRVNGSRPDGSVLYQVNKTKDGWLVLLINTRGIDKTQNGVARVDRRQTVDVSLRMPRGIKSAKEYTLPRDLDVIGNPSEVRLRLAPGDIHVVGLVPDSK